MKFESQFINEKIDEIVSKERLKKKKNKFQRI